MCFNSLVSSNFYSKLQPSGLAIRQDSRIHKVKGLLTMEAARTLSSSQTLHIHIRTENLAIHLCLNSRSQNVIQSFDLKSVQKKRSNSRSEDRKTLLRSVLHFNKYNNRMPSNLLNSSRREHDPKMIFQVQTFRCLIHLTLCSIVEVMILLISIKIITLMRQRQQLIFCSSGLLNSMQTNASPPTLLVTTT